MKRTPKKSRNQWTDHYTRKAKKDHYPARSVYKLMEIQKKNRIIKKGDRVLDLGCAPGSWLLYAAQLVGPQGRAVGIDIQPVTIGLPEHATAFEADIMDPDTHWPELIGSDFNVVISDMAPKTTGNNTVDSARSYGLCQKAMEIASTVLLKGGHFVCKIFQGPDTQTFIKEVTSGYRTRKLFKPVSSRKASSEIYVIGLGRR